jgi:hypothetical protein
VVRTGEEGHLLWNILTIGTLAEVMASTLAAPGIFRTLLARSSTRLRQSLWSMLDSQMKRMK